MSGSKSGPTLVAETRESKAFNLSMGAHQCLREIQGPLIWCHGCGSVFTWNSLQRSETRMAPCLLAYLSALSAERPLLWCYLSAQKLS